jgi:hypothetical protein
MCEYDTGHTGFRSQTAMSDETWLHYFEPKCKQHQGKCVIGHPNFKSVPPAGRIMITVFWEEKGTILVNFLIAQKQWTLNTKKSECLPSLR